MCVCVLTRVKLPPACEQQLAILMVATSEPTTVTPSSAPTISTPTSVPTLSPSCSNSELVTWSSGTGVSYSAGRVAKTDAEGWDAGALSDQDLAVSSSSPQGMTFRCTHATGPTTSDGGHLMAGLEHGDTLSAGQYADIEFGVQCHHNGNIGVYESGTSKGYFGPYLVTDVLEVRLTGSTVDYRKNGVAFYTSTSTATAFPLRVVTAMYSALSEIRDVTIFGTLNPSCA